MTDPRKTAILLIIFSLFSPLLVLADWKTDVNQYLKENKFKEAQILLESSLPSLSEPDRQEALALLPYIHHRLGQTEKEKQAMVNYFEEYNQGEPLFEFLDFSVFNPLLEFWGRWKKEYPLITNINFLVPASAEPRSIPEMLRLGFDLSAEAYYKIQLEGQPLLGGWWSKGSHLIQLPLPFSYEEPFTLKLDVFLKTSLVTVKKRIVLDFRVRHRNLGQPQLAVQRQNTPVLKDIEGEVAIYIGNTLIYKASKYLQKKIPVKITIPSPNPPGTKPYLVPQKDQYPLHAISVIDAVSAIVKTVKDWRKKPPEIAPSIFNRQAELNFTFINPEQQEVRTEVEVRLKTEKPEILPY
ncbi:MAG TPA: hypothetical protein PLP57_06800 [Candidatus Saccharicenans sp.]|jgi:hypothetical protein|nr:hypothetical protein [Candidatus Saccharicenans sp.]HRD02333.1 hypothetical protein [Candidatus Saccharicenans sp.]